MGSYIKCEKFFKILLSAYGGRECIHIPITNVNSGKSYEIRVESEVPGIALRVYSKKLTVKELLKVGKAINATHVYSDQDIVSTTNIYLTVLLYKKMRIILPIDFNSWYMRNGSLIFL